MPASDPVRQAVDVARTVSERLMPDDATVERWSHGSFDEGDPYSSDGGWSEVASTKGRVDVVGQESDQQIAERYAIAEPLAARLPAGTDVRADDRVTVGGHTMIVRVVQQPSYRADLRVVGDAAHPDRKAG